MRWTHAPVLAKETAELLLADLRGIYLDGTLGLGGHTKFFLERISGEGRIIGLDKDKNAVAMAVENVNDARLKAYQASYLDAPEILDRENIPEVAGALFDLGLSSYQLDDASRGFSFLRDGPLDMRFDNTKGLSAADLANTFTMEELERIIFAYGGERFAAKAAYAICKARRAGRICTTAELARIIASVLPRAGKIHPATKTFQALRIAVNDELNSVRKAAQMLENIIMPGGRAAFITFHSDEDRIIKNAFKQMSVAGGWRLVNKKPIEPSYAEIRENPRARSAKLRVIERSK